MRQYEYKGRLYEAYDDIDEFLQYSGKTKDYLVYERDLVNGVCDSYLEAMERQITGKYLVVPNTFVMPIIGFARGQRSFKILTPIGWLRKHGKALMKEYREDQDNLDMNFVAMFLLSGNLMASYEASYGVKKKDLALLRFLDVISKMGLRERIVTFMKQNGIENIFEKHGMTDEYLMKTLKAKLDDGKVTVGDVLKVLEAKKAIEPQKKSEMDFNLLPSTETKMIGESHGTA